MGADTRASTMGRCALEQGHVALLEPLAQLGDALDGVGAFAVLVDAAELVPGQAATREQGVSMGADTKANTPGRRLAKASANAVRGQYCQGRSLWIKHRH